ncbi:MAG: hypothetical protein EBX66_06605 [Betaproteobacteria bacterium]|nr:hypothetical protein [Betaproteobacteria bacterium]
MMERLQTPEAIRQRIWQELVRSSRDRHHAWRTPALATLGPDQRPDARTVVLRHVDEAAERLEIYTAMRSPKRAALEQAPWALFLFWSHRLRWQLRVSVRVSVIDTGPRVEQLWSQVKNTSAAADYLSPNPPGSALEACTQVEAPARHWFGIIDAQVCEIDWLELGSVEHRRARLTRDSWQWLNP